MANESARLGSTHVRKLSLVEQEEVRSSEEIDRTRSEVQLRSAVRALAPPVYPVGYLRRVGHVGGPAVRGCDDLAARSAFVISFFPSREDLLEAPDEGAEDEVLCLTA
ncbi:hypothetical protein GW17_00002435, partial [Ensete ventricosum]